MEAKTTMMEIKSQCLVFILESVLNFFNLHFYISNYNFHLQGSLHILKYTTNNVGRDAVDIAVFGSSILNKDFLKNKIKNAAPQLKLYQKLMPDEQLKASITLRRVI